MKMKRLIVALAAFAVTFGVLTHAEQASEKIDEFVTPADFQEEAIRQVNRLVDDVAALFGEVKVLVNTNANVVLTTVAPDADAAVTLLFTTNATNTFTTADAEAHDSTYLLRVSYNVGGSTNDWKSVSTEDQP